MKVQPTTKELIAMLYERLPELFDRAAPVQHPVAFFDWYDNAHWGNEDFKEGCHRSWNAAIKYTTQPAAQPTTEKSSEVQPAAQPAPVQEPVAKYIGECSEGSLVQLYEDVKKGTNFYTATPAKPAPLQEHCNMGEICAGCSPRNADGSCPHEKPNLACDCYVRGFNDGMKEMDGMEPYTTPPAQPAPVGHRDGHWCVNLTCKKCYSADFRLKHTAPPAAQRQWVGLTDEEVMQTMSGNWTSQFYFARAIEAKLKEKNTP
jgi:hypothetical protein